MANFLIRGGSFIVAKHPHQTNLHVLDQDRNICKVPNYIFNYTPLCAHVLDQDTGTLGGVTGVHVLDQDNDTVRSPNNIIYNKRNRNEDIKIN